jgi:hypothetical protein
MIYNEQFETVQSCEGFALTLNLSCILASGKDPDVAFSDGQAYWTDFDCDYKKVIKTIFRNLFYCKLTKSFRRKCMDRDLVECAWLLHGLSGCAFS